MICFKNFKSNNLKKHISKLEAQLSAIESYENWDFSVLINKIESISNDFDIRIKTLEGKTKIHIQILQQNRAFLQKALS